MDRIAMEHPSRQAHRCRGRNSDGRGLAGQGRRGAALLGDGAVLTSDTAGALSPGPVLKPPRRAREAVNPAP